MMNIVWAFMLIFGIISGIITGNGDKLIDSMITGGGEAVTLCFSLCGAYMLWMGLMEVAKDMGVIDSLARLIKPAMRKLFPSSEEAIAPITLNMAANFFGMGSAATPFGLEAMRIMQASNKNKAVATDDMCMFIAINSSALELLPTTILAMRTAAGSADPYCVVAPIAIASVTAFAAAVLVCKIFERRSKCTL